jgi:HlyD family secretion protein
MSKWTIAGAIAVSIGILGIGLFQVHRLQTTQQQRQALAKAPVIPARPEVTALGRIEPQGEAISVTGPSGFAGDRLWKLFVREGQQVKAGQPLAYLESYGERLAERNLAANQYQDAQARFQSETRLGYAQIEEARSRVEQASNPKSSQMLAQQATIGRIKAELASGERDLNRFQRLKKEGAIAQQTLDNQTLLVASKREELNNARATLEQLKQEKNTNVKNANAQLQSAQATLVRSQVQVQLASAASNLKLAEARLERTIIRAPQAGQILKILTRGGEAISTDGILEMGNTRQMYVVAEVYETDIGLVKVGQPVTIRSPAFKGEIAGTVEQVGLKVAKNDVLDTDPAANTDVRVVEVRIRLRDGQAVAGLTNLQVDVAISVDPVASPPAVKSTPVPNS